MATTWKAPKTYLVNSEQTNYNIDPSSILLFWGVMDANTSPSPPKKEGTGATISTFLHNKSALKKPFAHESASTVTVFWDRN